MLRVLIAFCLVLCLTACGYHIAGPGTQRLPTGQSLWVSFIGIEIDSPSAQTVLRRSLLEEFHAQRGLAPSSTEAAADMRISGQLRSYTTRAVAYSAADQIRDYALTIEVDLSFFRKGETAPFWKGVLQGRQNFPANNDLAVQRSSEEAALAAASRVVAQKMISAVEQSY